MFSVREKSPPTRRVSLQVSSGKENDTTISIRCVGEDNGNESENDFPSGINFRGNKNGRGEGRDRSVEETITVVGIIAWVLLSSRMYVVRINSAGSSCGEPELSSGAIAVLLPLPCGGC